MSYRLIPSVCFYWFSFIIVLQLPFIDDAVFASESEKYRYSNPFFYMFIWFWRFTRFCMVVVQFLKLRFVS